MKGARLIAAATAILLGAGLPATAAEDTGDEHATDPRKIEATYEVRWLDIPVFQATLTLDVTLETYRVKVEGRTVGLGRVVAPSKINWRTAGRVVEERFMPLVFVAERRHSVTGRTVELSYESDGRIVTQQLPGTVEASAPPVPEDLQRDSFDPLTALLNASARSSAAEACAVEAEIYDGDRRVDVVLDERGHRFFPATYRGPTEHRIHRCSVALVDRTPSAEARQANDLELSPTTIWVSWFEDMAAWLPVSAEIDSVVGMLQVKLVSLQGQRRNLN